MFGIAQKNSHFRAPFELKRLNLKPRSYIINGYNSPNYPFTTAIGGFVNVNLFFPNLPQNVGPWTLNELTNFFPYIRCSGVIVSNHFVLTAGHCFLKNEDTFVVAGTSTLFPESPAHYFDPETIIIHEAFNSTGRLDNDIAVIKVLRPFSTLASTQTICLTSHHVVYTTAALAGFGKLSNNSIVTSSILKELLLEFQDLVCIKHLRTSFNVQRQTCAGVEGKYASHADSGGPLFANLGDKIILIGVLSLIRRRPMTANPIIFTRISYYADWIKYYTFYSVCMVEC